MRATALAFAVCLAPLGCGLPDEPEPPRIIRAYELDRINGELPPAIVCADGAADQILHFETFALDDQGRYGRSQVIEIDDDPPVEQQERGDYEDEDSAFVLVNAADDTVVLRLLDEAGELVRRVHPCGDTLRYESIPLRSSD